MKLQRERDKDHIIPVDASMERKFGSMEKAYDTGFSSAQGTRNETIESDGEVKHSETGDDAASSREAPSIARENSGLAD